MAIKTTVDELREMLGNEYPYKGKLYLTRRGNSSTISTEPMGQGRTIEVDRQSTLHTKPGKFGFVFDTSLGCYIL